MKRGTKKFQIAVIGSAGKQEYTKGSGGAGKLMLTYAEELGKAIAKNGSILVTGGKSGIMEAASKGAKSENGVTVGIAKGKERFLCNPFVDVEVLTGMTADGFDELLLVLMSDALIVVGGGAGTLQEIAIAYRNNKPIVALGSTGGWAKQLAGKYVDERKTTKVEAAKTPREAISKVMQALERRA